jgi:hypothetical protein
MKKLVLYDDWRTILRKAWSIRFMALAGMLSGVEIILPVFAAEIPQGIFAALSFVAVSAAFVARLVAQKDV